MTLQVEILGPQFSTFVRSVMLCCEEKGIAYHTGMQLGGKDVEFKGEEHLAINPLGKLPVIHHKGRFLYETGPICRYLDSAFEGQALQPQDLYAKSIVDQWCQVISTQVDRVIVRDYLLEFAFPKGEKGAIRMDKVADAQPNVIAVLDILEQQIGDQAFICGDQFTIADALLIPMLDYLAGLPHGDQLLRADMRLTAYIGRMQKRASCQNVLPKPAVTKFP